MIGGYDDIDKRDAQVAGNPRIGPMAAEDFSPEARQLVEAMFAHAPAVDKSNLPDFFGISFKHPGLARVHIEMGLEFGVRGKIPPRERELATMRVAWLSGAPFEWGEHLGAAKRFGLSDEEIERITVGADAPGWTEHDGAIVRAVEELMSDYAISDATWAILAKSWTEPQLMELPGLVGHYVMTAMMQNTMRFDLLPGNPGLRRR
jgi:4-carboxymuconolactone decarboxylase